MPDRLKVSVLGADEVAKGLQTWSIRVNRKVKELINDTSLKVQNRARELVPVDTGRLRSSIRIRFYKNGFAAEISTDVEYAAFVEFGTGQRGKQMDLFGAPNLPEGYTHGSKPGMYARPYLWPAFEEHRSEFLRNLKVIVKA